jgi:hypothetical protein
MYDITIIGCGITGMLVLAILQQHKFDMTKICVIDPYFDGGNLLRSYGSVISNTPLIKTVNALKYINQDYTLPEQFSNLDLNSTTPLWILAQLIKDIVNPVLKNIDTIQSTVQSIEYTSYFKIQTEASEITSKVILLCQGAESKSLQCNIPVIPLHIGLNEQLLRNYVSSKNKVLVFGTSHSGCLVLENLHKLNIQTTAVHKSKAPFLFARDGEYDGIKEEAERIAQDILNGKHNNLTLLNISQIDKIIKISKTADYVIYCIGFETKQTMKTNFDLTKYDSRTGKLKDIEAAYGFGIAYPSAAPDGIHVDVGIISFVEHIQNQIEDIKKLI